MILTQVFEVFFITFHFCSPSLFPSLVWFLIGTFTLKARIHVFSPLYLVLKICIDSGYKKNKISSVLLNRLFETRTLSLDGFQVK